jgi:hypothetical protein
VCVCVCVCTCDDSARREVDAFAHKIAAHTAFLAFDALPQRFD